MTASLAQWFAGRRVLVTGHTGFKGSWLTAWLRAAGAEVTGFSLPLPEGPLHYVDARVGDGITSLHGDVRDAATVARVVRESRPELVLHLAAQALVRESYRTPAATFDTNVMGLVHLFEAVRATDTVRSVVVVTSDKCYENREVVHAYREDEAMGGHDPYSASKGCAELVTAAYRRSFLAATGVQVASARAGNVVGGGDWCADRLVPDLMRGAAAGTIVPIRHPEAVRPWQHVLEPVRGYLTLARALAEQGAAVAEGWNFGPAASDAASVRDVVAMLAQRWPAVRIVEQRAPDDPHEAGLLMLDAGKAAARLGWHPVLSLAGCMDWTAAWYRAAANDPSCAPSLLRDDLARYEARCAAAAESPLAQAVA